MAERLACRLLGIGHGDAILLRVDTEEGTWTALVDGGKAPRLLRERLLANGINRIDLLVLTHFDQDHIGGLEDVAAVVEVGSYWAPVLQAFDRHYWRFGSRIRGPLERAKALQEALAGRGADVIYPLEGYTAAPLGPDGPQLQVLSPPARLIRELLVRSDLGSFISGTLMPLGWLLEPAPPAGEQRLEILDLEERLRRGYLEPGDVPESLADRIPASGTAEPEFFGDPIVNNTSLVLWLGVPIAGTVRSVLLTGDLENWTYLFARHPRGLQADLLKASHHGGRVWLEKRLAFDSMMTSIRPKAVLVSGCGEHELPRNEFRDAAIRWGSSVFCTTERRVEHVLGRPVETTSCFDAYHCEPETRDISVVIDASGITADHVACHGGHAVPGPAIVVQQHVVAPSQIVGRLFENELRVHVRWVSRHLAAMHQERVEMQRPGLEGTEPVTCEAILSGAGASRRRRLEPYLDEVLDAGRRAGAFWTGTAGGYSRERVAYRRPTDEDVRDVVEALLGKTGMLFTKDTPSASSLDRHSLLLAQDTGFLALYVNVMTGYPKATFRELFWPRVAAAVAERWHCFSKEKQVLFSPASDLEQLGAHMLGLLEVSGDGTFGLSLDRDVALAAIPLLVTAREASDHGVDKWKVMAALKPWLNVKSSSWSSDALADGQRPLHGAVRQNW